MKTFYKSFSTIINFKNVSHTIDCSDGVKIFFKHNEGWVKLKGEDEEKFVKEYETFLIGYVMTKNEVEAVQAYINEL